MNTQQTYTEKKSAFRAIRGYIKKHGGTASDFEVKELSARKFAVVNNLPARGKKAEAIAKDEDKQFPPANATRAAELKAAAAQAKTKAVEPKKEKPLGARAQIQADAEKGKLPPIPDFSADTHTRFRPKLAELVALVKAKDVKGLKAYPINPISTSPKAMDRYRNLAVVALQAAK